MCCIGMFSDVLNDGRATCTVSECSQMCWMRALLHYFWRIADIPCAVHVCCAMATCALRSPHSRTGLTAQQPLACKSNKPYNACRSKRDVMTASVTVTMSKPGEESAGCFASIAAQKCNLYSAACRPTLRCWSTAVMLWSIL